MLFQKGEIVVVQRDAEFDAFSPAFNELSPWQRQQERWICEYEARWIERADQVLPLRQVNAHLTANRGVHLRQQRCRNVD